MYNFNPIGGDSGGPMFKLLDAYVTNILAMGTHIHSPKNNTEPVLGEPGWYSPLFQSQITYNAVSPGTDGWNVCITSSC